MTWLMMMMIKAMTSSIKAKYLLVMDGITYMDNKGVYIFEQNICSLR